MGPTVQKSFWTELTLVPAISQSGGLPVRRRRAPTRTRRQYEVEALRRALSRRAGGQRRSSCAQATQTALGGRRHDGAGRPGATRRRSSTRQSPLRQSLKTIAQVIAGDVGTRVFFATLGGFDTHANQAPAAAAARRA